jgi:hypothetical protein
LEGGDDYFITEVGKQYKTHSASSTVPASGGLVHKYVKQNSIISSAV